MKIYNEIIQGSEEWDKLRIGKFTATNAQAIGNNGAGLTTLVYEKAAEKVTGKRSKASYTNGNMENGVELEPLARAAYELETGKTVTTVGFIEKDEWSGMSPDGLIDDDGLFEAKCPTDITFLHFLEDLKVDTKYIWQVQFQLLISERQYVDLAMFNPNFPNPLIVVRIERDEEKIEKLRCGIENGIEQIQAILSKI